MIVTKKTKISKKSKKTQKTQKTHNPRKILTSNMKKSISKSKLSSASTSTSTSSKVENDLKFLKELVNSKDNNSKVEILKNLISQNRIMPKEFKKYMNETKLLSFQGKSGSIIGEFKLMPNTIIKFYKFNLDVDKLFKLDECLKIDNKINETLSNLVITYLPQLFKLSQPDILKLRRNTMSIIDYGFSDIGTYTILPKIGIYDKISSKYITNFRELLEYNHHRVFSNNVFKKNNDDKKNDDKKNEEMIRDILEEYDKMMSEKINNYLETLEILQKTIYYINSDSKLSNIFIRQSSNGNKKTNSKWTLLDSIGIITDFEFIIADLEKSSYTLNKFQDNTNYFKNMIITYPRNKLKNYLLKLIGYNLMYNVRLTCNKSLKNTKCNNVFELLDYDLLCIVILFYDNILKFNKNIIESLPETKKIFLKYFKMNDNNINEKNKKLEILINMLKKDKYNINSMYSYIINKVINNFCEKF